MRCCDCCNLRCNQRTSQIVGNPNHQQKPTHHVIATTLAMYRVQAVSRSSKSPLSSRLLRQSPNCETLFAMLYRHSDAQTSAVRRVTAKATPRSPAPPSQRKNNKVDTLNTPCGVCCACCGVVSALRCGKVWHALMLLGYTVAWVPHTMTRWNTVVVRRLTRCCAVRRGKVILAWCGVVNALWHGVVWCVCLRSPCSGPHLSYYARESVDSGPHRCFQ